MRRNDGHISYGSMDDAPPKKITLDGSRYREHLILYIDILGYSALMLSNEEEKKKTVLDWQREVLDADKAGFF